MKVRVLKRFKDVHTGELHLKGTTINISKERFEEIRTVGSFVEAETGKSKKKKETDNG